MSERITEAEALELERLEKAATPGPWTFKNDAGRLRAVHGGDYDDVPPKIENEMLKVAARNALPKLLAERHTLIAERDHAREIVRELVDHVNGLRYAELRREIEGWHK